MLPEPPVKEIADLADLPDEGLSQLGFQQRKDREYRNKRLVDESNTLTYDSEQTVPNLLDHLTITKELRSEGGDVQFLQSYVDKMLVHFPELKGKVKLLIADKGGYDAFAIGGLHTIVISRSIISLYDYLDEVLAIVAHELLHIVNKTGEKAIVGSGNVVQYYAIKWYHEILSDQTSKLLQNIGMNSIAASNALAKLAIATKNSRGLEHQALDMRALEALIPLLKMDSETTGQALIPRPQILHYPEEPYPTNVELMFQAIEAKDFEYVVKNFYLLHPTDMVEIYRDLLANYNITPPTLLKIHNYLSERIQLQGFSESEARLFLLSYDSMTSAAETGYMHLRSISRLKINMISDFADLEYLLDTASDPEPMRRLGMEVFGVSNRIFPLQVCLNYFLAHDLEFANEEESAYITIEEFKDILAKVIKLRSQFETKIKNGYQTDALRADINRLISSYIAKFFIVADEPTEAEQLTAVWTAVESTGWNPEEARGVLDNLKDAANPEQKEVIETTFNKVFNTDHLAELNERNIQRLIDKAKKDRSIQTLIRELAYSKKIVNPSSTRQIFEKIVDSFDEIETDYFYTYKFRGTLQAKKIIAELESSGVMVSSRAFDSEEELSQYPELLESYLNTKRFKYLTVMAEILLALYPEDNASFYSLFEPISQELADLSLKLDPADISAYSYKFIRSTTYLGYDLPLTVKDWTRFSDLAIIKNLVLINQNNGKIESFKELNEALEARDKHFDDLSNNYTTDKIRIRSFDDDITGLVFGTLARSNLLALLANPIPPEDYKYLTQFLDKYFPQGPRNDSIRRQVFLKFLQDPEASFESAMDLYFANHKLLKYEGLVLLGNKVATIDQYLSLRQKLSEKNQDYAAGKEDLSAVLAGDILLSSLSSRARYLLETTSGDINVRKQTSTELARKWIELYLETPQNLQREIGAIIEYDEQSGKIVATDTKGLVISLEDFISGAKEMPLSTRMMLALRLLFDTNGMLSNDKSKKELTKMIVESLNIRNPFLIQVLISAVEVGDKRIIGAPFAQLIAPFLFSSLDTGAIDYKVLNNANVGYDSDTGKDIKVKSRPYAIELPNLLTSDSRSIRYFGARFKDHINSNIAQIAQESGQSYFDALEALEAEFAAEQVVSKPRANLDLTTEAVIKAGETSGLFVRSMQMSVQLIDFEPKVEARLAQTQDSQQGLEKFEFFENLYNRAGGSSFDLIKQNLIKLGLAQEQWDQMSYEQRYTAWLDSDINVVGVELLQDSLNLLIDTENEYRTTWNKPLLAVPDIQQMGFGTVRDIAEYLQNLDVTAPAAFTSTLWLSSEQQQVAFEILDDMVELGGYLGGGSLVTANEAILGKKSGTRRSVVIKALNPNAEMIVDLTHKLTEDVLSQLKKRRGKVGKDAQLAASLIDLANTWTLRDINDSEYVRLDDQFQGTIEEFNMSAAGFKVMATERVFTSKKMKVEETFKGVTMRYYLDAARHNFDLGGGDKLSIEVSSKGMVQKARVVNQFGAVTAEYKRSKKLGEDEQPAEISLGEYSLQIDSANNISLRHTEKSESDKLELSSSSLDPNFSLENKQQTVTRLVSFFEHQFKNTKVIDGEEVYIFHSDPHTGNYMLDTNGLNEIAMIDRNLYLKITKEQMEVLMPFKQGSNFEFLRKLLAYAFKHNRISQVDRAFISSRVYASIGAEAAIQTLGDKDQLAYLRKILTIFAQQNIDIPIELRLVMRNIMLYKGLEQQWGTSN